MIKNKYLLLLSCLWISVHAQRSDTKPPAVQPNPNPNVLANSPLNSSQRVAPVSELLHAQHAPDMKLSEATLASSTEIDLSRFSGAAGDNIGNTQGESIDDNSHRMTLSVTDYTLKGAGGMNFPISRTRREVFWPSRVLLHNYERQLFDTMSDWRLDIPNIKIMRTSQSAFRVFNKDGTVNSAATAVYKGACDFAGPNNYWGIPPGGVGMEWRAPVISGMTGVQSIPMFFPARPSGATPPPAANPLLNDSDYVTQNNWKFRCATSQYNVGKFSKFIGYAPDGSVYEFDEPSLGSQDVKYGANTGFGNWFNKYPTYLRIFVSKITDRNGNWVKFDYKQTTDSAGNIIAPEMRDWAYIEKITTSDGKEVNFNWQLNPKCTSANACSYVNLITLPGGTIGPDPTDLEKYFFPSYFLSSFTAFSKTWAFEYKGSNFELTKATLPNTQTWEYALAFSVVPATPTLPAAYYTEYKVKQPKGASIRYELERRIVAVGVANSASTHTTFDSVSLKQNFDELGNEYRQYSCFDDSLRQDQRGILTVDFASCTNPSVYTATDACFTSPLNRTTFRVNFDGELETASDGTMHPSWRNGLKNTEIVYKGNFLPLAPGARSPQCPSFNSPFAGAVELERQTFEWSKFSLDPLSRNQITGVTQYGDFYYQDFDRYKRILKSLTTSRVNWGAFVVTQTAVDQFGNTELSNETRRLPNVAAEVRVTDLTHKNLAPLIPTGPGQWVIGLPETSRVIVDGVDISTSAFTYDGVGRVLSKTTNDVPASYTYWPTGDIKTFTDPRNKITNYSNYSSGLPQGTLYANGDSESIVVNTEGQMQSMTNARSKTHSFTYDELGRLKSVTYPEGLASNIVWSDGGRTKTTTRGNKVDALDMDGFGRVLAEHSYDSTTPTTGITKRYKYDGFNNLRYESDVSAYGSNASNGTSYTYDSLGRLIETKKAADNSSTTIAYLANETKVVTDANGHSRTVKYRGYGGASEEIVESISVPYTATNSSGVVVADVVDTTYVKDALGFTSSASQGGITRRFGKDARRFITSEFLPELGAAAVAGLYNISYCRDNLGNIVGKSLNAACTTSASANLFKNTYDDRGRLTLMDYTDSSTPDTSYTYDANNNLSTITRAGVVNTKTYTDIDKIKTDTYAVDGYAFKFQYGYDSSVTNLSYITYPSGKKFDYPSTAIGYIKSISNVASAFSYWPTGTLKTITASNGVETNISQNPREQVSNMNAKKGNTTLVNQSFTYDFNGNNRSISDTIDSSNDSSFEYDELNRLVSTQYSSSQPGQYFRRGYDDIGNVKFDRQPSTALDYTYDPSTNRMLSASGTQSLSFTYDTYGNMVNDGQRNFVFDASGDLKYSTAPVSKQFAYDGSQRIIKETFNGVQKYYLYVGNNLMMEFTPSTKSYIEHIYAGALLVASRKVINADQMDSDGDGINDMAEFSVPK